MKRTSSIIVMAASFIAACTLAACSEAPKPKPPAPVTPKAPGPASPPQAAPSTAPKTSANDTPKPVPDLSAPEWKISGRDDDPTVMEVAGIKAPKPATWTWTPPANTFRTLQYAVPAEGAGEGQSTAAAELVVSLFTGTDGGPLEPNIKRWVTQFSGPDGGAVEPVRSEKEVDGMKVVLVELTGTYAGMTSAPQADSTQLAAIVQAPGRTIFIRLNGPTKTVEGQRANWNAMIDGLKKSAP